MGMRPKARLSKGALPGYPRCVKYHLWLSSGGQGKGCKDNKHLAKNAEIGVKEKKKNSLPSITGISLGTISSYQHGSPLPHEQGTTAILSYTGDKNAVT